MDVLNNSAFTFACLPGQMNYPGHSLTLIVKGTFALAPGQKATAAPEQIYPTGDEYYPDDSDTTGAPRYASDFAHFKPNADLLLLGRCYAPGGKPVPSCMVTFQVGDKPHSIAVFGDRFWKRNAIGFRNPTDPAPFQSMELRYERSYGGEGFGDNPVGRGFAKTEDENGTAVFPLPNLENPLRLIDSPRAHPQPVGFGPLSRDWNQRREKMGTYKSSYVKQRWPWFPEDFDWTYFNSAPNEMQTGYLRGDERLFFENLHPKHAQYETWLPGTRVRCFVSKSADSADGSGFTEAPMNLDTLWVDMEAEQLVLVWRGWVETSSEEHEDIRHLFIKTDPLQARADSLSDCHQQFLAFIEEEKHKWEGEGDEASPSIAEEQALVQADAKPYAETEAESGDMEKLLRAQTAALLAQAGISPDELPTDTRARLAEEQSRFAQLLANRDPAKLLGDEQRQFQTQLSEAFNQLGVDARNSPPLTDKAKSEQLRLMKELSFGGITPLASPELSQFWAAFAASMPKLGIDPENLDAVIAEAKKHKQRISKELGVGDEEETADAPSSATSARLTREIVQERAQRGESFAGEDLRGLDLSELQLNGIDLANATLTGVSLQRAVLDDANLSGASLNGANLASASLKRAILAQATLSKCDLTGALLEEVDATGAKLTEANLAKAAVSSATFEGAEMCRAILDDVKGEGAIFAEADLSGASLKNASLPASDFSKAFVSHADFQGANLTDANFEAAAGPSVNFRDANLSGLRASEGCDLSHACFVKANAPDSCWEEARMNDADFSYARMESANFTKAGLENVNFYASSAKFGRFRNSVLTNAKLVQMNLFEASLEKANLTGADLSGSNLFGAELLDAKIETANFDGANLKMTKLA